MCTGSFFSEKKQLREREWMAPCGFCAAGCCWYGQNCLRSIRSRFSETAYGNQRAPAAESESDYASAESGSDSGNESADEGGMTGAMGCGAEGAVFDRALTPFLFEDFTEVVKGWKPSVGAADAEFRGFGEPPIFWMLNVVQVPVPPDCSGGGQCEVDELGFRFKQSKGAVMSQKAQRRLANQKKVEVVWAGPAVVREQRAVRRAPIRGAGVRKVLFDDSDGSGSTDDVPMVDQQHRLQSLRKIQLWLWRQQVQDHMGVIKICFQKWVGGGLAGWFVRNFARRNRQFCRSVTVGDLVQSRFDADEFGTDLIPLSAADLEELRLTKKLYPYPNKRLQVPVADRISMGISAVRMTAATVLRVVLLHRAVEVAQCSTYLRLKFAFEGWYWWGRQEAADRLDWHIDVLDDLLYPRWWEWTFYPLWRRWTFSVGVRRAERMLRKWGAERVGGATRQWLFNLCEWGQRQQRRQREACNQSTGSSRCNEDGSSSSGRRSNNKCNGSRSRESSKSNTCVRVWADVECGRYTKFAHDSRWCSVVMQLRELLGI